MIRLFLADDHRIVRDGIRRLLSEQPDFTVVGEAGDGDRVLTALQQTATDVLLLDLSMPGPGFLSLMQRIATLPTPPAVLVLSMQPEEMYGLRTLRAGAAGFVAKDASPQQLTDAVRRVASGRRYISPDLAESLALGADHDADAPPHAALSDRELQVLGCLGRGQSVKEIAAALHLSPKTISTYRARVLEKLGLASTAELIRYAVEHQLAD